jgi:hypothetical protein
VVVYPVDEKWIEAKAELRMLVEFAQVKHAWAS